MISVTLNFPSVTQATTFLSAGQRALDGTIAHEDRPDVGAVFDRAEEALKNIPQEWITQALALPPRDDPAVVFGGAVAPAAPPTLASVPAAPPVPAPSTAAAVPPSTAPVAPPATLPAPTSVAVPSAPSPAASAAAPAAPATPTSPAGAADLDSSGLKWDERIHAGNKSTNKDGTWRQKRGVDPLVVARVEAELRLGQPQAQAALPAVPPAAVVPAAPAAVVAPAVVPAAPAAVVAPAVVPAAPAAVVAPAVVPAAPAAVAQGHPSFADVLTAVVKAGKQQDEVARALASLGPVQGYPNGVSAFGELAQAAMADPSVMARFSRAIGL